MTNPAVNAALDDLEGVLHDEAQRTARKADHDDVARAAREVAARHPGVMVNPDATDWEFEGEWLVPCLPRSARTPATTAAVAEAVADVACVELDEAECTAMDMGDEEYTQHLLAIMDDDELAKIGLR